MLTKIRKFCTGQALVWGAMIWVIGWVVWATSSMLGSHSDDVRIDIDGEECIEDSADLDGYPKAFEYQPFGERIDYAPNDGPDA